MLITALLLSSALAAQPEPSDQKPSVLVVTFAADTAAEKPAELVHHYATSLFASDDRYRLIEPLAALAPTADRQSNRSLAQSEGLYKTARQAFESLELGVATRTLKKLYRRLTRASTSAGSDALLVRTLELLAVSELLQGAEDEATRNMKQLATISPEYEPNPRLYTNETMRQLYNDAKAATQSVEKGALAVSSNPNSASVHIDGRFVGVTPVAQEELVPGAHVVRVTQDGYLPSSFLVQVRSNTETNQHAELDRSDLQEEFDALRAAAADVAYGDSDELPISMKQLAGLFGADHVWFARIELRGERIEVDAAQYDLVAAYRQKRARQVFAYDSRNTTYEREVGDLWQRNFSQDSLERAPVDEGAPLADTESGLPTAASEQCGSMSCSEYKAIWVISGVVVGVALTATGVAFQQLARIDNNNFRETPQSSPAAADLRSRGRSRAIIGDALLFGGIAVLGGTALMYTLWDPKPDPGNIDTSTSTFHSAVIAPAVTPEGWGLYGSWQF